MKTKNLSAVWRMFSAVLFLCMAVLPSLPTALAETDGFFTYFVFRGQATITGCDPSVSGELEIPSVLGGVPVRAVENGVFLDCDELAGITIPANVTEIKDTFSGCEKLTSMTVHPDNPNYHSAGNCLIETKSKTLVSGCKASVIPNDGSVVTIADDAFFHCEGLLSIIIPASVTTINNAAFSGCINLTNITVDPNNPAYHSAGNCLIETGDKTLVLGCMTSVIPDDGSVTNIGKNAFSGCTKLTDIAIPNGILSLGEGAFSGCEALARAIIPDSVIAIGKGAFSDCKGLKNLRLSNRISAIEQKTFSGCSGLTCLTIPESVLVMNERAFYDCAELTDVTLPAGVTSISFSVFSACPQLHNVWFEGSRDDKNKIIIKEGNKPFTDAVWHFDICKNNEHAYDNNQDADCNNCEWVRTLPERGDADSGHVKPSVPWRIILFAATAFILAVGAVIATIRIKKKQENLLPNNK